MRRHIGLTLLVGRQRFRLCSRPYGAEGALAFDPDAGEVRRTLDGGALKLSADVWQSIAARAHPHSRTTVWRKRVARSATEPGSQAGSGPFCQNPTAPRHSVNWLAAAWQWPPAPAARFE